LLLGVQADHNAVCTDQRDQHGVSVSGIALACAEKFAIMEIFTCGFDVLEA
jgi:hypothetical protein